MGPGLHPQYTRADFGQEAVGGLTYEPNQPHAPCATRYMVAEHAFRTTNQTQISQPASSAQLRVSQWCHVRTRVVTQSRSGRKRTSRF